MQVQAIVSSLSRYRSQFRPSSPNRRYGPTKAPCHVPPCEGIRPARPQLWSISTAQDSWAKSGLTEQVQGITAQSRCIRKARDTLIAID